MFGRKPAKTHTQMMMDELAESYDHFRQAAGHMAGGASERLGPRYERARGMANRRMTAARGAVTPLMLQMREGATNARTAMDVRSQKSKKKQRKRWPALVGLLAAGTAVGATGAMIVRRRRAAAEWEEQEAVPPIEYGEPTRPEARQKAAEKVAAGATSMAESVSAKASKMADSAREGMSESARPASKPGTQGTQGTQPSGPTSPSSAGGRPAGGTTASGASSSGTTGGVGATEPPGPVGGSPLRDLGEKSTGSATGQRNSSVRSGSGGSSSGKSS